MGTFDDLKFSIQIRYFSPFQLKVKNFFYRVGTCEVFATRIKPAKIKYFLVYDYFPSLYLKQVKFSVL